MRKKRELIIAHPERTKEGYFTRAHIGEKLVAKEALPYPKIDISKAPPEVAKIVRDPIKYTEHGYNVLTKVGLPVAKLERKVTLGQKIKMLLFRKVRPMDEKTFNEKFPEVVGIIKKSIEKGVYFDAKWYNFGVDKDGRVVIMDTNFVNVKGRRPEQMFLILRESLQKQGSMASEDVNIRTRLINRLHLIEEREGK